jgi:hypothetical protein
MPLRAELVEQNRRAGGCAVPQRETGGVGHDGCSKPRKIAGCGLTCGPDWTAMPYLAFPRNTEHAHAEPGRLRALMMMGN